LSHERPGPNHSSKLGAGTYFRAWGKARHIEENKSKGPVVVKKGKMGKKREGGGGEIDYSTIAKKGTGRSATGRKKREKV